MPQFARLGRRGAAWLRDGPYSRAGRSRIAPEEVLTMANRSISDRTPLYAVVILTVGLGIAVSALALLALIFFF